MGAIKIGGLRQFGDGLFAGIDQIGVFLTLKRERPHAQHTVLRLQRDVDAFGDVVRHQRRDANAKVHISAVLQFLRRPCGHLIAVPHGLSLPFARGAVFDALFMVALNKAVHIDAGQMDGVGVE